MSETSDKPVWGVYGGSTRGSSHLRSGLPNQDSIETWSAPDGSQVILAVSDGHGSASHFRSEIGSRMGVEAAVHALRETPVPVPDGQAQVLAESIVQAWREAVMAHLTAHPFTDQEWAKLPPKEAAQAKAVILANPPVAYGATLLAVLAAQDDILYLQLGDGDILSVDQNGGTGRPVPADVRLIANQTTSLCQKSAVQDFRSAHFRSSDGPPPALILVSSDGYANSFLTDEDFLRLGPDYLELLRQYGPDKVQAQLEKILPEASRKGSGDDITLGFIQRMDKPSVGETAVEAETQPAPVVAAPQPPVVTPGKKFGRTPPPTGQSHGSGETTRLRQKVFRLKIALAGLCLLALTGAGLAYCRPLWLSHVMHRMLPSAPKRPIPAHGRAQNSPPTWRRLGSAHV